MYGFFPPEEAVPTLATIVKKPRLHSSHVGKKKAALRCSQQREKAPHPHSLHPWKVPLLLSSHPSHWVERRSSALGHHAVRCGLGVAGRGTTTRLRTESCR